MSMFTYVVMAVAAGIGLVWRIKLAHAAAAAAAPIGASFTFLALATGSIWGKPTWGTWWVWDARLTTELILLFLYLGYIALVESIEDTRRADQAGALLALVGSVNVPIIYFSVKWWNSLHQLQSNPKTVDPRMAAPLRLNITAWFVVLLALLWTRYRIGRAEQEREQSTPVGEAKAVLRMSP
jgi:heme exporter protein C